MFKPHQIPVTFIPTKLRRPAESGIYLCICDAHVSNLYYCKEADAFNVHVSADGSIDMHTAIDVIMWANIKPIEAICEEVRDYYERN